MIYVAMTGAKHILGQQAAVAHNLANVSTNGYRAAASAFRAVPVEGEGLPTRTFVVDSTSGSSFAQGALQRTGRELDVAVQGPGWIAVQANDGSEAYTRNGSLEVNPNGMLQTRNGLNVLGDGGPISIPPDSIISIAKEGTVDLNGRPATMETLESLVKEIGGISKEVTVVIRSDENTPLRFVTEAMDICRKQGLNKIRLQSR